VFEFDRKSLLLFFLFKNSRIFVILQFTRKTHLLGDCNKHPYRLVLNSFITRNYNVVYDFFLSKTTFKNYIHKCFVQNKLIFLYAIISQVDV